MNYRLIVLTHGDAPTLADTIASFAEMVTPAPSSRMVFVDGEGVHPPVEPLGSWEGYAGGKQLGFCGNSELAWLGATQGEHAHVFWLEHDFRFLRPVDLRPMAVVLDTHPELAQMALMRDAVNDAEKAAGGLFESRPGQYRERYYAESSDAMRAGRVHCWQEHQAYLTTNPSLMRREFMAGNPWPEYESECEGRFGIDLVEKGYTFGVWGDGSPWVEHTGVRSGFGY